LSSARRLVEPESLGSARDATPTRLVSKVGCAMGMADADSGIEGGLAITRPPKQIRPSLRGDLPDPFGASTVGARATAR